MWAREGAETRVMAYRPRLYWVVRLLSCSGISVRVIRMGVRASWPVQIFWCRRNFSNLDLQIWLICQFDWGRTLQGVSDVAPDASTTWSGWKVLVRHKSVCFYIISNDLLIFHILFITFAKCSNASQRHRDGMTSRANTEFFRVCSSREFLRCRIHVYLCEIQLFLKGFDWQKTKLERVLAAERRLTVYRRRPIWEFGYNDGEIFDFS